MWSKSCAQPSDPVVSGLFPHEKRLPSSKQYRLICERRNRFLDSHPEYLDL